jgi:hypothetical protein
MVKFIMRNPVNPDDLKCPACTAVDFKTLGIKGFVGRQLATIVFGFLADIFFSIAEQAVIPRNTKDKAIIYKCLKCGNKWAAFPVETIDSDYLNSPCEIHFTRESSIVGWARSQFVYLNGKKIGPVKNRKRISFTTKRKHNLIFVTDHLGRAFDTRRFDGESGGSKSFNFNRKFL